VSGRAVSGTFIPDRRETLLLRAALLEVPVAPTSWEEWIRQVPMEEAEEGSYRLYPLVYKNLSRLGVGVSGLGKLKGAYRHTWYRNQLLLHRSRAVLDLLAAHFGTTIVFTIIVVLANIIVDICYAYLDPRVRLG